MKNLLQLKANQSVLDHSTQLTLNFLYFTVTLFDSNFSTYWLISNAEFIIHVLIPD